MQPAPVERTFVPIAWPRMLTGVAVALAAAAAVLAVLSQPAAAFAALSISVCSLAVSNALHSRDSLRLLRSQRTAQQTGYERMRQILKALEALQADRGRVTHPDLASLPRPQLDARSEDVLRLIANATSGSRVLLIGGPLPEVLPDGVEAMDAAEPGGATLQTVPHGLHTHVLIEPATLAQCDLNDVRWLRRAFRWQHDTVMAVPTRAGTAGLEALSTALSAPLAIERQDRITAIWTPFGGGSDWGSA